MNCTVTTNIIRIHFTFGNGWILNSGWENSLTNQKKDKIMEHRIEEVKAISEEFIELMNGMNDAAYSPFGSFWYWHGRGLWNSTAIH